MKIKKEVEVELTVKIIGTFKRDVAYVGGGSGKETPYQKGGYTAHDAGHRMGFTEEVFNKALESGLIEVGSFRDNVEHVAPMKDLYWTFEITENT